jgi:hypothetical protein
MSGYIFNFQGKSFTPDGKVPALSQSEVDTHNRAVEKKEMEYFVASGKGVFYLTHDQSSHRYMISTWAGGWKVPCLTATYKHFVPGAYNQSTKRNHCRFIGPDGKRWHGWNIGDNQIVRAKRYANQ